MRVTLHFEKTTSGGKGHRVGKRQKNEVIICENRPRFGKQNSAQKNMYFCLHRSMQLNGAHVGIRLAWRGTWPTD